MFGIATAAVIASLEPFSTASAYSVIREFVFCTFLTDDTILGIFIGLLSTISIGLALFVVGLRELTKLFSYTLFGKRRHRSYCIMEELRYTKLGVIRHFGKYLVDPAAMIVDKSAFLAVSTTRSVVGRFASANGALEFS